MWVNLNMKSKRPSAKVFLDSEDFQYIDDYNQVHGGTVQSFAERAIKKYIEENKAEQFLKDKELIK